MFIYGLRRVFHAIPTLLGITLLTFVLFNIVGRNPALSYAGKNASAAQIATLNHELGLDRSLPDQYFFYLHQIVTFDFGASWASHQQIQTMILDGLGASLSLAVPGFVFTLMISVFVSIICAMKGGQFVDRLFVILSLAGMSISILVYILVLQYVFAFKLGWFPISGFDPSWSGRWSYLVLGWIIWTVVSLGPQILFFRSILIEESFQDYIRTARAKGVSQFGVYFRHVVKNAMIPIITLIVLELPLLFTGSLFIESFFQIPGLGGLLVQALANSDFPVIKAMTFIGALLYVVFNLVSDLLYSVLDPRIQLR